jgi:hypothetical protein
MSTPADGPDVYQPVVREPGPSRATVVNVTTTQSGQVSGERQDYII